MRLVTITFPTRVRDEAVVAAVTVDLDDLTDVGVTFGRDGKPHEIADLTLAELHELCAEAGELAIRAADFKPS